MDNYSNFGTTVSPLEKALDRVRAALQAEVNAREAYRNGVNRIDKENLKPEAVDAQIAALKGNRDYDCRRAAEEFAEAMDAVIAELDKKHSGFSPDDAALQNALRVISATGAQLEPELADSLLNGLSTQPQYKVVRAAMKAADMDAAAVAAVEKRIYDYKAEWGQLKEYGTGMLRNAQVISGLAQRVAKLAEKEGVKFDWQSIEPEGFTAAMRQAAGLPEE